jgi:group I intron endonuclease
MIIKNLDNIEEIGVYSLKCLKTGKIYIGSTTKSFKYRFNNHVWELNNDRHKNKHLANAWKKYKENNFEFEILEVTSKEDVFIREQYYMDLYKSHDKKLGFNINSRATGGTQFPEDVRLRRAKTLSETNKKAKEALIKVKSGELLLEDVPKEYRRLVEFKLNFKPPRTGKTIANGYSSEGLKGKKKTITQELINAKKLNAIKIRENRTPRVLVYDATGKFLYNYRSISDIHDDSLKNPSKFPTILRNDQGRNGKNANIMSRANIGACCHGRIKHYKGLIFRWQDSTLPIIPLTPEDFGHCNKEKIECKLGRLLE